MKELQEHYNEVCNKYALQFATKHDYPFDGWVADKVGEVATMGDYSVDFREIKYDIDNDIDADEYVKYYDYCLEVATLNLTAPNYESWCKGCPRIPQEVIDRVRGLRHELNTLIIETKNTKTMTKEFIGTKVLVRSYDAGVYFGTLEAVEGETVKVSNVRNIWRWEGASCLSQIANDGIKSGKVGPVVSSMIINRCCQIVPLTAKAIKNLENQLVWTY